MSPLPKSSSDLAGVSSRSYDGTTRFNVILLGNLLCCLWAASNKARKTIQGLRAGLTNQCIFDRANLQAIILKIVPHFPALSSSLSLLFVICAYWLSLCTVSLIY